MGAVVRGTRCAECAGSPDGLAPRLAPGVESWLLRITGTSAAIYRWKDNLHPLGPDPTMPDIDFIPISVATLLPSEVVGLDLYQQEIDSERLVLYRGAEYPITLDDLNRLRGRGVSRLYISKEARATYQKYLRKIATSNDPQSIPLSARAGALNEVVRDVLHLAFAKENLDQTVNAAEQLGVLAADIVTKDEFAANDLFEVLHHDYATFTHSANVAFYCGILAAELGFSRQEIEQVTTGGLLHDLGKLAIEEEILCKPGRLSEQEFRRIRMHPVLGFRKLAHREDLSKGQLMMAYQHHERLDGKGYPVGCVSDDIHPWAKLCAVVDVFEALTSQRPYRTPMPRSKALMLQQRDSGTAFDSEILKCWTSTIQRSLVN
jgi:HD-GYP domain-containing protein (c-di-GMP phosphodiesterase class II)